MISPQGHLETIRIEGVFNIMCLFVYWISVENYKLAMNAFEKFYESKYIALF